MPREKPAEPEWEQGTVYLRHVRKDGSSYVDQHWSWHVTNFLKNQLLRAAEEGGEARIEVLTEAQYRTEKWSRKRRSRG